MDLFTLDLMLRSAAGSLCLLLILIVLRDAGHHWSGRFGALVALDAASYLICSAPGFSAVPFGIELPVLILCLAGPAFLLFFAKALFDDNYRPGLGSAAILIGLCGFGLVRLYYPGELSPPIDRLLEWTGRLFAIALVGFAIWEALRDRGEDLIEDRRRFRLTFVTVIGSYIILISLIEGIFQGKPPLWLTLLNPAAILVLSALLLSHLVELRRDRFLGALRDEPADEAGRKNHGTARAKAQEKALLLQLDRLMREDHAYLEEGLSIGALAKKLNVPEYRLRRLINRHLGFRNFSAYLNGYRIAAAKKALADPNQAHLPILSIGLGLGYASIGPFNRAFKAETGQSPSEYRHKYGLSMETSDQQG